MPKLALAPAPASPDSLADLLRQVLANQQVILAELAAVKALVRRPSSPNETAADAAFLAAVAESVGGRTFTSSELLEHATVDAALAAAFERRFLETAREVGHVLKRIERQQSGPIRVARVGVARDGIRWRVVVL
jgi:hypothetical protein